jgi:hypothetical protein
MSRARGGVNEMSNKAIGQLMDLKLQAIPTDHIGTYLGFPVRIWQGVMPDGSNFVLYVSAFTPIAGFVSDEVLATLQKNCFSTRGVALPNPEQAIACVQGVPDGIDRDNVRFHKSVLN